MQEGDLIDDRYRIEKKLGQGGMGLVFRAHDVRNNKPVAIKVLFPNTPDIVIKRFHAEAKALGALNHPNIMPVQHFGQEKSGQLYLVMELIKGDTLAAMIEKRGAQSFFDVLPIFERICRGLRYAHLNNVLHRDIKPSNVMMASDRSKEDSVKLVDFGLAKQLEKQDLTKTGSTMGSPPYMSPEAVHGKESDVRSEIYSLGCTFFEMLAGRVPFVGDTQFHVMMAHVNRLPPTLSEVAGKPYEEVVEEFVQKCMKKNPNDRFQNMDELMNELERVKNKLLEKRSAPEGIIASGIYASGAFIRERKRIADEWFKKNMILACVIGLVCVIGTTVFIYKTLQDSEVAESQIAGTITEVASEIAEPELQEDLLDVTEGKSNYDTGAHLNKDRDTGAQSCLLSGEMTDEQLAEVIKEYKTFKVFQFEKLRISGNAIKMVLDLGIDRLVVVRSEVTNELFEEIGNAKTLKHLKVVDCGDLPQGCLDYLKNSKSLQSLDLEVGMDYKGIGAAISSCKSLTWVSIIRATVCREDIRLMVSHLRLVYLGLNNCTIRHHAFNDMIRAYSCTFVMISNSALVLENVTNLASIPNLQHLGLRRTGITDEFLPELYRCKNLVSVDLTNNDVTEGAIAKLKEALPNLQNVKAGNKHREYAF